MDFFFDSCTYLDNSILLTPLLFEYMHFFKVKHYFRNRFTLELTAIYAHNCSCRDFFSSICPQISFNLRLTSSKSIIQLRTIRPEEGNLFL